MSPIYRSFAKINLHLQVVGRREDGYHELRTLFQTVELHDLLGLELTGREIALEVLEGDVPRGEGNLAVRAARLYLERWAPGRGVALSLRKRIPVGGGLGGGSSNAATVLLALQDLLGSPASSAELWEAARELGADVPYFLVGGTALGFGRGDEVLPVADLPETAVWLVVPELSVSTAEIFAGLGGLTARPLASSIMALAQGGAGGRLEAIVGWNDLQAPALSRHPLLQEIYDALRDAGASVVRLSGTGATFFAFPGESDEPSEWMARLPSGTRLVPTRSLSRASAKSRRIVQ